MEYLNFDKVILSIFCLIDSQISYLDILHYYKLDVFLLFSGKWSARLTRQSLTGLNMWILYWCHRKIVCKHAPTTHTASLPVVTQNCTEWPQQIPLLHLWDSLTMETMIKPPGAAIIKMGTDWNEHIIQQILIWFVLPPGMLILSCAATYRKLILSCAATWVPSTVIRHIDTFNSDLFKMLSQKIF